jgi:hypothetical protein
VSKEFLELCPLLGSVLPLEGVGSCLAQNLLEVRGELQMCAESSVKTRPGWIEGGRKKAHPHMPWFGYRSGREGVAAVSARDHAGKQQANVHAQLWTS